MKELTYRCARNRVDWRKLSLFGAMLIVAGLVFQMFTLPYSLNMWFLSRPAMVSLSGSMNGTIPSSEAHSEARAEQFQFVPTVPIVSANFSLKLIQSMPVEPKKVTDPVKRKPISRRRKKNIKPDDKSNVSSPPPPHKNVPSRFQVGSMTVLLFIHSKYNKGSYYESFPSYLQRYIWSLPPNEALVYAKKEIEHTPVVVDDPDLFAPLFQNVSVFRRYMS